MSRDNPRQRKHFLLKFMRMRLAVLVDREASRRICPANGKARTDPLDTQSLLETIMEELAEIQNQSTINQIMDGPPRALPVRDHPACPLGCNKVHKFSSFFFCKKFRALPLARRMRITSSLSLCENCLSGHGKGRACPVGLCHACKSPHNILLCEARGKTMVVTQTSRATCNRPEKVGSIEPSLVNKEEESGERTLDDTENSGLVEHLEE